MSDTTLGFDADLVLIYHSQSENVSDAEPLANVEEDVQGHVHEGRCVVSATETYPILARKVNHPTTKSRHGEGDEEAMERWKAILKQRWTSGTRLHTPIFQKLQ